MDFLKAGGMKKRKDVAKNPEVGEVSLSEVRLGGRTSRRGGPADSADL